MLNNAISISVHRFAKLLLVILVFAGLISCSGNQQPLLTTTTASGLDNVADYQELFSGKNIGIVTNHSAYNSQGQYITDVFAQMPDVRIAALFGPEHGIRGSAEAGEKVASGSDPLSGIPIYSLYGKTRKPTAEMLENVDLLVFDIQDVGARFYTYIYTMSLAMEAAAEKGIPYIVLDRPNPISGDMIDGNVLDTAYSTFVGMYPIPTVFGMTMGELARMFNEEGWLQDGIKANLTVIGLSNWHRNLWYDQTGLKYIKPSPNIPTLDCAAIYPGTCLIEGTNASEGRGTKIPFRLVGAPWIDGNILSEKLNELNLPGLEIRDTVFTPVAIDGASTNPKHKDQRCGGIVIDIRNRAKLLPYSAGIEIVRAIHQLYPDSLQWRAAHFDRLCGTDAVRKAIIDGQSSESLQQSWQEDREIFAKRREKYLLY